MNRFCDSPFWNSSLTWNTTNPDFTSCFEELALLWPACGFLWLTAIFDVLFQGSPVTQLDQPTWRPGWTRLGVLKLFNIGFLVILEVATLAAIWMLNSQSHIPPVLWTSTAILVATHCLSAALIVIHKSRCVHTSGIQLIHWFLLSLVYVTIFRTELLIYFHQSESSVAVTLLGISSLIIVIQTVFFSWSDIPKAKPGDHSRLDSDDNDDGVTREESPELRASCLSNVLFSYATPLVRLGHQRPLTKDDLWGLLPSVRTKPVNVIFERAYGSPKFGEIRGIWRNIVLPILKTCGWSLVAAVGCRFSSSMLEFASPKLMGLMIDFVGDPEQETWKGYLWAILLFGNYILIVVFLEQFFIRMFRVYMNILVSLNMKIYRKALSVTSESRKESTSGEIVNLMSVDVHKVCNLAFWGSDSIWTMPTQIILGIVLLYFELGVAIFAGVGVLCAAIPINWVLTKYTSQFQNDRMKKKDERVKILNEILAGIQIIKLYAWEPSFQTQAQKVRADEITLLRNRAFLQAFIELMFNSVPFLVSTAAFLTYMYVNGTSSISPKQAFTALSLFNILTEPITHFPSFISQAVDASVSFKRINKFLNAEELHPEATRFEEPQDGLPSIEIRGGSFSWETSSTCLTSIELSVEPSSLTVIVGSVASGKSSLLAAILGDMKKLSGSTVVRGSVAYAPQVPWIINATLRENICFGLPYEKEKYERIIDACCLSPDLEVLPAGDLTEIGEKGINLSGGQKQRVSLARAAYNAADILLLDDVLSAVDTHVGRHIFDKLLGPKGLLSGKTRVLCTHAYNFLSQVDHIVVMSEGKIVEAGSYEKVMEGGNFSKLVKEQVQTSGMDNNNGEIGVEESGKIEGKKEKTVDAGKMIKDEDVETGDVKWEIYMAYLRALKTPLILLIIALFCSSQGLDIERNIVLSKWTDTTSSESGNHNYLLQYAAYGLGNAATYFAAFVLLLFAFLNASRTLHDNMLARIIRAPMSFFNVTLLGRIVNRFSSDVENVDSSLPYYIGEWIPCLFKFLGVLVTISYTNTYFILYIVPLSFAYYFVQRYYIKSSQQLQRLQAALDSPIYSQFSETLNGTSTIRSYRAQDRFADLLAQKMDNHNRALWPQVVVRRWLSVRLGILGSSVVFIPALFAVIWRHDISPSLVGLSITYALQFNFILSWFIKCTSFIQTTMVSVERILEYSEVEQEAEWENSLQTIPPDWPQEGAINFKNYETRYRPELDLVLKQFSCSIRPGEKIGIVGRTGAGKSSLTLALFRIIEAAQGQIFVDGVDIAELGLHDVRKKLTVIPQDPVLFGRSLRLNLDPFGDYTDDELWSALELAHLKSYVNSLPEGLSYQIDEGGENLSVGQRQLVCLARAILRKSNVLVLDEATASVDTKTDELIQATIRSTFKGCTILNVAHRLNTVMDSSRIMVLSRGEIVEFDTPQALLADSTTLFYGMAKDAGIVSP